jgi:hypothetical protein
LGAPEIAKLSLDSVEKCDKYGDQDCVPHNGANCPNKGDPRMPIYQKTALVSDLISGVANRRSVAQPKGEGKDLCIPLRLPLSQMATVRQRYRIIEAGGTRASARAHPGRLEERPDTRSHEISEMQEHIRTCSVGKNESETPVGTPPFQLSGGQPISPFSVDLDRAADHGATISRGLRT